MSFLEILDTLLLKSIELIFEIVYMLAYKIIGNPGLSIIILSLFMNFLVLPLYMRADAIQEEEHAIEKKLQKGVDHIKRTFKGDERMMMLQTYYRQNHYKPIYVLRSAVSLLLQVPFFIAAYRFLSGLSLLKGASLGPIADLGSPDGMLAIGGVSINLLPFVMTAVNLASCVIFTKGSPWKAKIQLYAMALFFLVFLYYSPAGLVFYWTLNNVFSLVKTCFYKLKNPEKILCALSSCCGILIAVCGLLIRHPSTARKAVFIAGIAVLLQSPLAFALLKNKMTRKRIMQAENRRLFFAGGLFLAVLTGALIPSSVIGDSPLEFMDLTYFYNPIWFIVSSFCLALGIFVVWTGIFYFLAKPVVRIYFDMGIWILSGVFLIDYMFFGKDLGLLTRNLTYENKLEFTRAAQVKNILAVIMLSLVFYVIFRYREKLASEILAVGVLALCGMTVINVAGINASVNGVKEDGLEKYMDIPRFTLSKTGKNVIVLILDRAGGKYIPYLFHEKPELEKKFDGFTYYPNTISFGAFTMLGAPALYGGYEYTPAEINKRDEEPLVSKNDEALKVMPALFYQNGCRVTICDPSGAGYRWIPDLSIYNDYPGIESYVLRDKFLHESVKEQWILADKRNFFCYGLMKTVPIGVQKTLYDYGRYNQADGETESYDVKQVQTGLYTAIGLRDSFMDAYNTLCALPEMTDIADDDRDTFLSMVSYAIHEPMMLQEPDYVPAMEVDNTEYERANQDRYTVNGETLRMGNYVQYMYYQSSMATMLKLGEWFDYMREQGVYDNTRIILVADHGQGDLFEEDEHRLGESDIDCFRVLLMVKDFDSRGFATSEEFMTNGDVPTLAMKDIIDNPINPFTGKRIDSSEKTRHDQYVSTVKESDIEESHGNTFLPSKWYAVHDDMRDVNNWKLLSEDETILPLIKGGD